MKLRTVSATMAATLCLFTAPTLLAAPFLSRSNPATVQTAKVQMVSFQIRNSSGEVLTVAAGPTQFTLQRGETRTVKLPAGQNLVSQSATAHYGAGAVMATVDKILGGNTLVFN